MVTHGRTMTTKVSFEDCVSTIAKYAFHSTPYPLIVSLEVHCNPEQQGAMVDLMMKYWKNMVVTEPLITNAVSLPSPEELRGKILVKVKAADADADPQPRAETSTSRSRARSVGSAFNRAPSVDRFGVTSTSLVSSPHALSPSEYTNGYVPTPAGSVISCPTGTPSSSADDSDDLAFDKPRKRNKTSKIIQELGVLGVYAQGIKYNGFAATEARTTNHIFSFSENTFEKLCTKENDSRTSLERHNLRYLMRVYPAARRIDSSNFNPLQAWRRGVQMAALNWQTYDVHQQVNEAMFAAGSDRLGYVLKPEELRHAKHLPIADTIPEAPGKKAKKGKKIVKFTVDIKGAQRLPRPRNQSADGGMNPFIEFEMYSAEDKALGVAKSEGGIDVSAPNGASGIGLPVRKRSRIVSGNGFDPIYHDSIMMTVETKYPSLIFVRWTVWHTPDDNANASNSVLLGSFTAKLSSLQQGYRHLPLSNPRGEQYREAKLFVNIKKEAPIPVEILDNAYGIMESSASSPRLDIAGRERSWRQRVFSRNSSQRRASSQRATDDVAGVISRTSSMDRET
jgi:phosphatidylinositol phospholipase C, delta